MPTAERGTMGVTTFHDYPLGPEGRRWDSTAAEKRVRKWAGAQDEPNAKYRDAHLWYDAPNKTNFTAYKLPICDVVKGELVVLPHAVLAAGGVLQGAHGGVDIPAADVKRAKNHLARYYKKLDRTPPWEG